MKNDFEPNQQKKILVVIAPQGFQDDEYSITRAVLEENHFPIEVVSSRRGVALGKYARQSVVVEKTFSDIDTSDYQALVLIGGPGAEELSNNHQLRLLIQKINREDKLIGAICLTPAILAKADILNKKKATVWSHPLDNSLIKILKDSGAIYVNQKVIVDGRIVTANGPEASREFAQKIVEILKR